MDKVQFGTWAQTIFSDLVLSGEINYQTTDGACVHSERLGQL